MASFKKMCMSGIWRRRRGGDTIFKSEKKKRKEEKKTGKIIHGESKEICE